jgi:DNA-binding transcriptional MerR regulator
MAALTIGKAARAAGVSIETVRFYERSGLLQPPPRTPAGYRQYPAEVVQRLAFIRRAQRLGFSLTEVAELLALQQETASCDEVKARAAAKIASIDEKVAALEAVKGDLQALIERCDAVCDTTCTVLLEPEACGTGERTQT